MTKRRFTALPGPGKRATTSRLSSSHITAVGGLNGDKFDRLDVGGDGDCDVVSTKEVDNLGIIWIQISFCECR